MKINIFIAYAQSEQAICEALEPHLHTLQQEGFYDGSLETWSKAAFPAQEWDSATLALLANAQMVLLLISPDFLKDQHFCQTILENLLEQHHEQKIMLLPIITKKCAWENEEWRQLPQTPMYIKWLTNTGNWASLEEALQVVSKDIQKAIQYYIDTPNELMIGPNRGGLESKKKDDEINKPSPNIDDKYIHKKDKVTDNGSANEGKLAYDVPTTMYKGEKKRITVEIGNAQVAVKMITKKLEAEGKKVEKIKVDKVMEAQLWASDTDFKIETFSSTAQFLTDEAPAKWVFFVTPLQTGNLYIVLKVTIVSVLQGYGEEKRDIVFERNIDVKIKETSNHAVGIQKGLQFPAKILFVASNPTDTGKLRLDEEYRDINEGLRRANFRDNFELIPCFATRSRDLRLALLEETPQILHFSGHGTDLDGTVGIGNRDYGRVGANNKGGIILENKNGKAQFVSTNSLSRLFKLFKNEVRCVILNSCYSELQAKAIVQYIPFVIGMNTAIPDKTAIAFAVGFYDALGAGKNIEFAFEFALASIDMDDLEGEDIPVLLKKES